MTSNTPNACACGSCKGASCACGCQTRHADATRRPGCACGATCHCGAACTCSPR